MNQSMETANGVERIDKLDAEVYHANEAIGSSMLETFRKSRREFHGLYVAKTLPRKEATPAMQLGTLCHLAILEPDEFRNQVSTPIPEIAPDGEKWDRRKKAHKIAWQRELDAREGLLIPSYEESETVKAIVQTVFANRIAAQLIDTDGQPEVSLFWTDEETGLRLKCRVDWLATLPIDLKTACDVSPAGYARSLVRFGYHRKLAHYSAGLESHSLEGPLVHLAVSTTAPHSVAVYELDDADKGGDSLGQRQWRQTLRDLAHCYETGDWSDPWEQQVTRLRLPGWAFYEDDYQLAAS